MLGLSKVWNFSLQIGFALMAVVLLLACSVDAEASAILTLMDTDSIIQSLAIIVPCSPETFAR